MDIVKDPEKTVDYSTKMLGLNGGIIIIIMLNPIQRMLKLEMQLWSLWEKLRG